MIRAHMATYPPRLGMLEASLPTIVRQVDQVFLCLNEYDAVPGFLSAYSNVTPIVPERDMKDVGKFVTQPAPDDLVVFVDDDVLYHANFVRRLRRLGRQPGFERNVFGFHGSIYRAGVQKSKFSRQVLHFRRGLETTTRVDQLATNSMMALGKNVAPLEVMEGSQKFVDVRYARWLYENGIGSWAISRRQNFLRELRPDSDDHETIWDSFTRNTPEYVLEEIRAFAGKAPGLGAPVEAGA